MSGWPILSVITFLPLVGAVFVALIRGDDEVVNMSAFAHFERYTGGLGGASGAFNRVNVAELKILAL